MRIVIEGAGEVGSHLAKMLSGEANEITVIDNDESRLTRLSSQVDVVSVSGNPSSIRTLKEAGVPSADMFSSGQTVFPCPSKWPFLNSPSYIHVLF
jgi:trk system potassium uptake protein TrkA